MANFGDFNFGDDAPSPDTDPVPDNAFPEEESESDGKQNDVANYPEPGESDTFDGGDPTEFSVYSNPEEPGAQQDHSPPIINTPRRPDSVGAPKRKYVKQIRKKSQLESKPKQTTKPRKIKSEAPVEDQIEEEEEDTFIRKLRKAGFTETDYADTNFEPFIQKLKDAGYNEIDYADTGFDSFIERLRDAGFGSQTELATLQREMFGSELNAAIGFDNFISKLQDAGFDDGSDPIDDPTGFGAFVDKLYGAGFESSRELYTRLTAMFGGIPPGSGGLEGLLYDTFGDFISRNDEDHFSKAPLGKRRSPVSMLELDENDDVVNTTFERVATIEFDENASLLSDISASENLEELDMLDIIQFVESVDLNDYLGDTIQDSNLIEFQAESYDWLL